MNYDKPELDVVSHSLGISVASCQRSKRKRDKKLPDDFYRNYFNASEGHSDMPILKALCERGLMFQGAPDYYHVTEAGKKAFCADFSVLMKPQQEKEPEFTITIEQLKANGWKINETGFPYLAEKHLGETEGAEDDIKLVIHTLRNKQEFALVCPDGTMVGIGPYTIDDLLLFERMILYVEPPY